MDLGIAGRKAIVCASSRGLGRACALALARAKCDVVLNGMVRRNGDCLAAERLDLAYGVVERLGVSRGDNDLGGPLAGAARNRPPEARGSTGDDDDLL